MKHNKLAERLCAVRALTAAVLSIGFAACGEVKYPDGVEGLPTHTTTETVRIIYDTTAPTSEITFATTTPTEERTVMTITTPTETETETATETVYTTAETTALSEESISLKLEDVPQVDISEYYEKTQTQATMETEPTYSSSRIETETSSSETTEEMAPTTASFSEGVVTSASTASVGDEQSGDLHEKLTDGRISKYTGREIISHPYSYYTLSDKHKMIYDRIVSAMLYYDDSVLFSTEEQVTFEELFDVYQLIYNDEYRLFYMSSTIEYMSDLETGYVDTMNLKYTYKKDEVIAMQAQIDKAAADILSKITPQTSDYEIAKLFHDTVITSCTYKETPDMNTIYGCLVENEALCQGYSRAFTFLCSEVGIDSLVVLGVANEPHMWNIVELDGEYYHIDLTWDDPDRAQNPDAIRYDYFGLTDERIRQLRQVDDYDYDIPKANGKKYHYYEYNGYVASTYEEAKAIIIRQTKELNKTKSSTIQFMCSNDGAYELISDKLLTMNSDNIIAILTECLPELENKFETDEIYHNSNKSTRTIKIYLNYK